jgi:hypothetical protein
MGVYQFRAPSGSTIAVGNTAIATGKTTTQHVAGLLMTSVDSAVVWVSSDWGAAAVETLTPTADDPLERLARPVRLAVLARLHHQQHGLHLRA